MNLQQLSQELVQRKTEFTQLKLKVKQINQNLLELSKEVLTPEEKEFFKLIADGLFFIAMTAHEKNRILGWRINQLKSRLEDSPTGEKGWKSKWEITRRKHLNLESMRAEDKPELLETIEFLFLAYGDVILLYTTFLEAMEKGNPIQEVD